MLDIQIVSDLHVEFLANKNKFNLFKPSAPILALLGDICCCGSNEDFNLFKYFISTLLKSYEHIILVAGNHEYYYNPAKKIPHNSSNTIEGIDEKIRKFFQTSNKLHYLNNNTLKLTVDNKLYYIIGSTLWSWIPPAERARIQANMNDYNYIFTNKGPLTSDYVADKHLKNYKYIKTQLINAKKQKATAVVLTHHKPYTSKTSTNLDFAYESDLSSLFKYPIAVWAYGHTHIADNSTRNGIWFYSNPKGYPHQKTNFKRTAVLSI